MNDSLLRDRVDEFGRSLFDAADEERPRAGAQEALLASLALASAAGVVSTASVAAPVTTKVAAWSLAGTAKWVLLGAMIAGPVTWYATSAQSPSAPPQITAPSTLLPVPVPVPVPVPAPAADPEPEPAAAPDPVAPPPPVAAKKPSRNTVAEPRKADAKPEPSVAPAPSTPNPSRALADQVELLDEARRRLRDGDPRGAFEALDKFDLRHGAGAPLAPEARAIRADARRAASGELPSL